MKKIINKYPVYLFIFSILSPLSFLQIFCEDFRNYDFYPKSLFLAIVSICALLLFRRLFRDPDVAGLAALGATMAVFPMTGVSVPVFPLILVVGLGLTARDAWRRRQRGERGPIRLPRTFTYKVNIVAIFMMIVVAGHFLYVTHRSAATVDAISAETYATLRKAAAVKTPRRLPSIVHIVLDGYSRGDVLQEVYGFDNAPFLNALRERGFRVAANARRRSARHSSS